VDGRVKPGRDGLKRALPLMIVAGLATSPADARDTLTIGVSQFPSELHPDINPEAIKAYVLAFADRSITAFDKDWHNTCLLCTEVPSLTNGLARIETQANGRPGMAVTVKLRPGLVWGDGVALTTRDIAFAAKVGADPASGFADLRTWGKVGRVEIIDDRTAVLHTTEIDAQYDRLPDILPEHIEGPVYAAHRSPGDYERNSVYNRAPTTPGLYNGPFLITADDGGTQIVLEPNPHWTGDKPFFHRIVIKAIGNTAALQENLLSGDIDLAPGDAPGLTIDQVLAMRQKWPDRFSYRFRPALTYENVSLNLDNPILADLRVRRALLASLNRQVMVERLFAGMQPVASSFVNPQDPMFADDVPLVTYDPARARALLAEAGWTPGPDGICRNEAGARLSLNFQTTAGNRLRELQEQVMQDQWRRSCIETVIKNEPARTFFGETIKKRSFTGMAMFAWTSSVSGPPRQTLASDHIPTAANAWGGSNIMDWHSARMDRDISAAETELDPVKQKAAWRDMQHVYAEDLPVLPLFFRAEAHVVPIWLQGYEPTGNTDTTSTWAEEWRAP
jgi:peptide/nickel transport system substrate-binding protein